MIVDRISYKKIFPIGSYANETIGLEAEVDVGDDIIDCYKQLKIMAEKFHKDNNPQLIGSEIHINPEYAELLKTEYDSARMIKLTTPTYDLNSEKTEAAIDNATTLEQLDLLMGDAAKYGLHKQLLDKRKTLCKGY